MKEHVLHIKNMVCPRCVASVERALDELEVRYHEVELGQVHLVHALPAEVQKEFEQKIKKEGFELLEPGRSSLISMIKSLLIEQIHHAKEPLRVNYSTYLSDKLNHDYSYLSRLFSSVEGITIEKFIAKQKIEKVKELLFYNELTLGEIADQMDYSSVAYLTTQFRKETGMTTTEFRKSYHPNLRHLDSI